MWAKRIACRKKHEGEYPKPLNREGKQASRRAAGRAKQASRQAGKQASRQAGKRASRQAGKLASLQAGKQAADYRFVCARSLATLSTQPVLVLSCGLCAEPRHQRMDLTSTYHISDVS